MRASEDGKWRAGCWQTRQPTTPRVLGKAPVSSGGKDVDEVAHHVFHGSDARHVPCAQVGCEATGAIELRVCDMQRIERESTSNTGKRVAPGWR